MYTLPQLKKKISSAEAESKEGKGFLDGENIMCWKEVWSVIQRQALWFVGHDGERWSWREFWAKDLFQAVSNWEPSKAGKQKNCMSRFSFCFGRGEFRVTSGKRWVTGDEVGHQGLFFKTLIQCKYLTDEESGRGGWGGGDCTKQVTVGEIPWAFVSFHQCCANSEVPICTD